MSLLSDLSWVMPENMEVERDLGLAEKWRAEAITS